MSKEYDFIVGFTLFTPKGFRTMYRHFDNLEIAEMFASNVNIKDNHKIYVDLDLYNEEKERNIDLELENIGLKENRRIAVEEIQEEYYISKDKIREEIKELERDKKKLYKEQGNIEEIKIYSVIDIIEAEILRFKELLEEEDV